MKNKGIGVQLVILVGKHYGLHAGQVLWIPNIQALKFITANGDFKISTASVYPNPEFPPAVDKRMIAHLSAVANDACKLFIMGFKGS